MEKLAKVSKYTKGSCRGLMSLGRKLLSFLGTTKYYEAYYSYKNKRSNGACQFILEALVEFFCKDWGDENQIIVFLTEESKKKNWLSKTENQCANFERGLGKTLEDCGLHACIKYIEIPEGRNEDELWEIFEKITEAIDENDNIIFDITHSFRSLPLLTLIVLNYVKFLKNVNVEQIFYGALEALGTLKEVESMDVEKRIVPIFNLTPFVSLFDWTVAIDRYLKTGNAEMVREVGIEQLKPQLAKTRGEVGGGLRALIDSLDSFSRRVSTCRGPNFKSDIERISKSLPLAEKELEKLRPFSPLIEKINSRFSAMNTKDDVTCGLEITNWCLENNLLQQGFTILRETIVNYTIMNILESEELKKQNNRKNAETMLNSKHEKIPKKILDLWQEIIDYRNDINHGGWSEQNFHSSNDFRQKLREFSERAKKLLAETNEPKNQ